MGLAPLAGAQPPNVIIGTIVGTTFAITTGVKPDVAVGVAVPFAVAVQMGITFLFSVMSGVMSRCDRMAANADTNGIERVNYLALLALGLFYFLCAFLPIYFGAEHAKTAIDVLPERLIDGLGVAGGIMPAIGFAVLLKIMMKNVYIPYFIIGFVAAALLKLPVLAIAAAALAMALIDLMRKSPEPAAPAAQKENSKMASNHTTLPGVSESEETLLTGVNEKRLRRPEHRCRTDQKDINRVARRSMLLQASFNYERMQASGWLYGLLPALKKIHTNKRVIWHAP